jgi:hypothetical protein
MAYIQDFEMAPDVLREKYAVDIKVPLKDQTYAQMRSILGNYQEGESPREEDFMRDIHAVVRISRDLTSKGSGQEIRSKDMDFLDADDKFMNICSETSKMIVAYMQALGHEARVVWMDGHTVSEVWFPERGWVLVDGYFNVMFYDNSVPVGLNTVTSDYWRLEPRRIVDSIHENMPDLTQTDYFSKENVYNKQWLFIVLSGEDVLSISYRNREIGTILKSMLNIEPLAVGVQILHTNDRRVGNVGIGFYRRF